MENAGMFVSAQTWNRATVDAKINRRQSRLFLFKLALTLTALPPDATQDVMQSVTLEPKTFYTQ
jgi:hypothetical protein